MTFELVHATFTNFPATENADDSYNGDYNEFNPSFDFPVAVYPYDRRIMTKKGSRTRMTPFVFVIVVT
jgi:hypothetical protein